MYRKAKQTFLLHAEFETFLESAVLALVAMMLINRTAVVSATRVRQVATHGTLKETLATFARQHTVMFAGTFVTAYSALQTADRHRTATVLNSRLDRRVRLELWRRRRRARGNPVCDAERRRTYVVIVVVIVSGSRVGGGSPSWNAGNGRCWTHKAARDAIHRRPRSAGHLRRR